MSVKVLQQDILGLIFMQLDSKDLYSAIRVCRLWFNCSGKALGIVRNRYIKCKGDRVFRRILELTNQRDPVCNFYIDRPHNRGKDYLLGLDKYDSIYLDLSKKMDESFQHYSPKLVPLYEFIYNVEDNTFTLILSQETYKTKLEHTWILHYIDLMELLYRCVDQKYRIEGHDESYNFYDIL